MFTFNLTTIFFESILTVKSIKSFLTDLFIATQSTVDFCVNSKRYAIGFTVGAEDNERERAETPISGGLCG